MADLASDATAQRCETNATLSASVHDNKELFDFYKEWSEKYDEDFRPEHYIGPRLVVEEACNFVAPDQRSDVTVIDVAAGTGLVGLELSRQGFVTVDALDGCEAMLEKLRRKKVYRKGTKAILGGSATDGMGQPLPENEYDVVTCSGGFVPGHLPATALHDLCHLCKPGGYVIVVMRHEYLTVCKDLSRMNQVMANLEEQGCWNKIKCHVNPNYLLDKEGVVFVFRKTLNLRA